MKKQIKFPDYKWVIVFISGLMVFTVLGFCSSANSMYIAPITEALGITRSSYSLTTSVRYVTTAVVNVFFGALIYRFGAKKLIIAGFVSLIISQLIYSFSDNVIHFSLGSVFLGIGLSFTTTAMVGAVVNKWSKSNKGTVMGVILATNGVGAAVARMILTPIINSGDVFGYRTSYRTVSLILLSVLTVMILFFRDGRPGEATKFEVKSKKPAGDGRIFKRPCFYAALVCIFLTGLVLQSISGIADPHLRDNGVDLNVITFMMSLHAILLSVAKFSTGFIYDRCGIRIASGICYTAALVGMLSLALTDSSAVGTVLGFTYGAFSSIALPLETIMLPIFARELFGEEHFNRALGIFVSVNTAGYALGGPIANLVFDLTGSYDPWIFISVALIGAVAILMNGVLTVSKRYKDAELTQDRVGSAL